MAPAPEPRSLPILACSFDASGAADAGARGHVVCVVDVVDGSTSAEAALAHGATAVLGAAPDDVDPPVPVRPDAIGMRALALAGDAGVVVVAEPRVGAQEDRQARAQPVLQALEGGGAPWELIPNQGAELPALASLAGRVVVVVSATGGTAFDAALAAGAPAACFATTARIEGLSGWEVGRRGAERAIALAQEHATGLTVVAASANSTDDVLGAQEIARLVVESGFLRP